jgi:4-hydroxybenzoate polyprenyltransferase
MSFGSQKVFSGIQEALVLALMLLSVFVLFYVNIGIMYKVGIAIIVFTVIFLTTLATQILRQEKENRQAQATAA